MFIGSVGSMRNAGLSGASDHSLRGLSPISHKDRRLGTSPRGAARDKLARLGNYRIKAYPKAHHNYVLLGNPANYLNRLTGQLERYYNDTYS